jgi:hypothetical protein
LKKPRSWSVSCRGIAARWPDDGTQTGKPRPHQTRAAARRGADSGILVVGTVGFVVAATATLVAPRVGLGTGHNARDIRVFADIFVSACASPLARFRTARRLFFLFLGASALALPLSSR